MQDMNPSSAHVCVLDDDQDTVSMVTELLERLGHRVAGFVEPQEAIQYVAASDVDVFVTDLMMEPMSGLDVCERVLAMRPWLPIVILTGQGSMETAVGAIRAGAFDFLIKPVEKELLGIAIERARAHHHLSEEVSRLRVTVSTGTKSDEFVGNSGVMQKVFDLIGRVAPRQSTILIEGETGTGKELTARAIHDNSLRRAGPFVAINCAAFPPHLIESELFGHVRGAFTDASETRRGLFVAATGGTLFIDEIGELPAEMQPKLLRALQERRVRPIGSNVEVPFDARIVVATNRDLQREVEEDRFREDLYYRVSVVSIRLPPLRERGGDVAALAKHFLVQASHEGRSAPWTLSDAAVELLLAYSWPGNVRELENCMARVVALAQGSEVTAADLPDVIREYRPQHFAVAVENAQQIMPIAEVERLYVRRVLSLVHGNKTRAAELLGYDRRTIYRKIERWGLA